MPLAPTPQTSTPGPTITGGVARIGGWTGASIVPHAITHLAKTDAVNRVVQSTKPLTVSGVPHTSSDNTPAGDVGIPQSSHTAKAYAYGGGNQSSYSPSIANAFTSLGIDPNAVSSGGSNASSSSSGSTGSTASTSTADGLQGTASDAVSSILSSIYGSDYQSLLNGSTSGSGGTVDDYVNRLVNDIEANNANAAAFQSFSNMQGIRQQLGLTTTAEVANRQNRTGTGIQSSFRSNASDFQNPLSATQQNALTSGIKFDPSIYSDANKSYTDALSSLLGQNSKNNFGSLQNSGWTNSQSLMNQGV